MNNPIEKEDLIDIANSINKQFYNSSIFVTGATGLVGSTLIKGLLMCNELNNSNIKIIALIRSEKKAKMIFGNSDIEYVVEDITKKLECVLNIDYIIHGASATASKFFITKPVDTIKTSIDGTMNILELAKEKAVKKVVYLSSMEMYGIPYEGKEYCDESILGYINPLQVRSCYSEGKRMCENICASYASQYGVNVVIARLSQTFGSSVNWNENRIFASIAKSVINKEDVILHSKGESVGNYCYTSDVINALFILLEKGNNAEAYNISNEATNISIKNMASMVCKEFSNGNSKVVIDLPKGDQIFGYAPDVKLKLNNHKMMELGWRPKYDLREMYERLINSLKYQMEK
ncbi:MAG: NAD-dependent epimerase/dehydratase family protein [Thomasclavelia sp.]|jgi:UDP-glucuronate decarboxylase|nr:NAD-dependent epimerase/dehydratase family protein [Thomasclavelia sp.]